MNAENELLLIDLNGLCELHAKSNLKQKTALEELFYLCTNDSFIESVSEARQEIKKISGCDLPVESFDDILSVRNNIYKMGVWDKYQLILEKLRKRHSLVGEKYNINPLLQDKLKHEVEEHKKVYLDLYPEAKENEVKEKATISAINEVLHNSFSCLESIIFFNNPVLNLGYLGMPFSEKGGTLKVEKDIFTGELYIIGRFYINSSKQEIKEVVERYYPEVLKSREKINIPSKKDYPKTKLFVVKRIYELNKQGKKTSEIALNLDNEKLTDDATLDMVRMTLKRLKKTNKRFDVNEQEI